MNFKRPSILIAGLVASLGLDQARAEIRFARDIQPILADHCYACHGPDSNQRKADFRLDIKEGAFRDLGGYFGIAPNKPNESELITRIHTKDTDDLMPPPDANVALTENEKRLLRQWIQEGATWEEHWAFIRPSRPNIPLTGNQDWVQNPIDSFVLSKLETNGDLAPSAKASDEQILRRLTIDLTGLPPSLTELDAFLRDSSPDRHQKTINRLLSSEAYAERMALEWMDVARYADSHGMHADGWRMMWPWRDWVINAFQRNQPYDEFVTWQLAGDLLPDPSDDQIIATAFHRNHAMTAEGGIVDEEFRIQYVFDRAQTTATAFLGLTLECARCHDHKFDPLSQKDYYRMTAFFNNLKELGMTGDDGNYGPMHLLASRSEKQQQARLEAQIESKRESLAKLLEGSSPTRNVEPISPPPPSARFAFDSIDLIGEKKKTKRLDANELTKLSGNPELEPGKIGQAIRFNSEYDIVTLEKAGLYDSSDSFSVSVWVNPDSGSKPQTIIGNSGAKNNFWRGWEFSLDAKNHVTVKLIHSLPHSYIHVHSQEAIPTLEWSQLTFTYDGSSHSNGINIYINGSKAEIEVPFDRLHKTIYPVSGNANRDREDRALRVGKAYRSFTGEYGIYSGLIDEVRLWDRNLTDAEAASQYNQDLASNSEPHRVTLSPEMLESHYAHIHPKNLSTRKELTALYKERQALVDKIPELMVMEEISPPRKSYVLRRGQYDAPTDEVKADTPTSILPFSEDYPRNRLGLAQWLFDEQNPLTARVTVNRYWQLFFGKGLVETSEDFGKQGSRPSHPDLLDWLAVEFRESGWNLKHLHKLIVTSATYQQSSDTTAENRSIDPENQHLARGPRHRLPAELIRDQALAASGLLVPTVGGPSVKPFQPEGLWIDKGNFSAKLLRYKPDTGEQLYRRSLYTFIRRTSPHPAMVAFDAPNRDICQVRRESTNTPLQALVLLNDPQFVEAARVFAERIQVEAGDSIEDQIVYAFRTVTSRNPSPEETSILRELLEEENKRLSEAPEAAKALLGTGSHPSNPELDPVKTAALAVLANTLLNHDSFYTKR